MRKKLDILVSLDVCLVRGKRINERPLCTTVLVDEEKHLLENLTRHGHVSYRRTHAAIDFATVTHANDRDGVLYSHLPHDLAVVPMSVGPDPDANSRPGRT